MPHIRQPEGKQRLDDGFNVKHHQKVVDVHKKTMTFGLCLHKIKTIGQFLHSQAAH